MKITQSATATNQPEKNPQALFEIVEDVNLEKLVGGKITFNDVLITSYQTSGATANESTTVIEKSTPKLLESAVTGRAF